MESHFAGYFYFGVTVPLASPGLASLCILVIDVKYVFLILPRFLRFLAFYFLDVF